MSKPRATITNREIAAALGRGPPRMSKAKLAAILARSEELSRQRPPLTEQEIQEIAADEKYARIQNGSW
jgi:hypothetical protein